MAENKTYMPQSTAGLIRYFESEGGVKIKPEIVIGIGAGFGVMVAVAKLLAA